MSEETRGLILDAQRKTGAPSMADVIRVAVQHYAGFLDDEGATMARLLEIVEETRASLEELKAMLGKGEATP